MDEPSPRTSLRHRILVVDDYPDAADIMCKLLAMLGHECHAARNGRAAIDEAQRFDPDIAIIDIGLPDMNGYDVARALRACTPGRRLYLAAVTGWTHAADRALAYSAGFDQHILKPVNVENLMDVLRFADGAARPGAAQA